jgi:hypothetical protein
LFVPPAPTAAAGFRSQDAGAVDRGALLRCSPENLMPARTALLRPAALGGIRLLDVGRGKTNARVSVDGSGHLRQGSNFCFWWRRPAWHSCFRAGGLCLASLSDGGPPPVSDRGPTAVEDFASRSPCAGYVLVEYPHPSHRVFSSRAAEMAYSPSCLETNSRKLVGKEGTITPILGRPTRAGRVHNLAFREHLKSPPQPCYLPEVSKLLD